MKYKAEVWMEPPRNPEEQVNPEKRTWAFWIGPEPPYEYHWGSGHATKEGAIERGDCVAQMLGWNLEPWGIEEE